MQLRKKLHEDIVDDDEDGSPKRKIKKLDTQCDLTAKVFGNDFIVRHVIKHIIGATTILSHLNLRLINKSFNTEVLSKVRSEYVKVQVSPDLNDGSSGEMYDEESDEEDEVVDRSFVINDRIIFFSNASRFFSFLNAVARIRIQDLLFAGFSRPDRRVHLCILEQLLADNWFFMASYKGAEEICPGCDKCSVIAARARYYGPVQFRTLTNPVEGRRHYRQLIISEILLAEIAYYCVVGITTRQQAFDRLESLISPAITCDQLDLVFSDRPHESKNTLAHPREVIDWILYRWRIKTVNIRFITEYSSVDYRVWASHGIFTPMRFDEKFSSIVPRHHMRSQNAHHFKRVEVDMQSGDEIATCFAESMGLFERGGLSATAFQNVCANIKRVFPNQDMFLVLPIELASVAAADLYAFCSTLLEFAWKDERTARHSRIYFRLFTFGITGDDVKSQVQKDFRFNSRKAHTSLSSASTQDYFVSWLPGTTSCFERHLLSFSDVSNNCVVHLEVCIEPP